MHNIADGTLELFAVELASGLHVSDRWFDRATAMNHLSDCACKSALLTGAPNGHAVDLGTAISAVDNHDLWLYVAENVRLLRRLTQGTAVEGIARHGP